MILYALIAVDGLCGEERIKCGARAKCVVSKSGGESCECSIGFYQSGSQCEGRLNII